VLARIGNQLRYFGIARTRVFEDADLHPDGARRPELGYLLVEHLPRRGVRVRPALNDQASRAIGRPHALAPNRLVSVSDVFGHRTADETHRARGPVGGVAFICFTLTGSVFICFVVTGLIFRTVRCAPIAISGRDAHDRALDDRSLDARALVCRRSAPVVVRALATICTAFRSTGCRLLLVGGGVALGR
jgi:hypothetical protein